MTEIGRPRPGDVVYVTSAAGSVGMIASQIAKLCGARVVGSTSKDFKVDWLLNTAKLDGAFNYETHSLDEQLSKLCPDGIDIFFDTVGGETMEIGLNHVRRNGRVVVCAAMSQMMALGQDNPSVFLYGIKNIPMLTVLRAKAEGFIDMDYFDRKPQSVEFLRKCLEKGEIKIEYDMQEGFENIPKTVQRLFRGENLGKLTMQINPIE